MAVEQETRKEDLICKECVIKRVITSGAGFKNCDKHGVSNIDWKCNFCCSVALFHCGSYGYFCAECHKTPNNPPVADCNGVNCPLGVSHPPPKKGPENSFPLGCGLCRSEKLMEVQKKEEEEQKRIAELKKQQEEEEQMAAAPAAAQAF